MTWKSVLLVGLGGGVLMLWFVSRGCACSTKDKAYVAAMKSDLRNAIVVQEGVFARDSAYARALQREDFSTSTGVTLTVLGASKSGWGAVTSHNGLLSGNCYVYVGRRPARVPETVDGERLLDGEPRCERVRLK